MKRKFYKRKQGFMLIELSIALVVIGLLFAGISGGTALIENAKIRATLSQIETIKNAALMFNAEYGLPPGGLQDTLDYFPNAMYKDDATDPHTCVRENPGGVKEIAAEGAGNSTNIHGFTTEISGGIATHVSNFTNAISKSHTRISRASIAICQLHASKYIDLPNNSKVFSKTTYVKHSIHFPKLTMYSAAAIILMSDIKNNNLYSIILGNANTSSFKYYDDGWSSTIGGNIPGNLLKKLDLKLSTGNADTGDFLTFKMKPEEYGSSYAKRLGKCEYKKKEKNCKAIYKLSM